MVLGRTFRNGRELMIYTIHVHTGDNWNPLCARTRARTRAHAHTHTHTPQENIDIYATKEPQEAFHQRILFCLDLYNQSVKVYQRENGEVSDLYAIFIFHRQ